MKKNVLDEIYSNKGDLALELLKNDKDKSSNNKMNWKKLLGFESFILDKDEFDYSVFYKEIKELNNYELVEIWRFLKQIRDIVLIDDIEKEMIQRFKNKYVYAKENAMSKEFGSNIFDKRKFIDTSVYWSDNYYLPEHIAILINDYLESIENKDFKQCIKLNYKIHVLVENSYENDQISYEKYLILKERYKI